MTYFGILDYIFMGIYVLVLVGMGFVLKRVASKSLDNYIVGGRHIPWWALGVSGMANFLDLTGTAVIVSFLFLLGPQGLFIEFRGGAVLILVFMMLWAGKWHRRSGCLTAAEWNIFRFGDGWGGRFAQQMAVFATVISTIGMLAYLIVGAGSFLAMFLPYTPMQCAVVLLVLASLYTMLSGFYGVVVTDMFQMLIIMVAVVYVSVKAFMTVGNASEVAAIALQVTENPDWISGMPKWNAYMPKGYEAYKHLILFMSFYLLRSIFAGIGSGAMPQYFGARNDRECGLLSFLWTWLMTFRWPLMIGIAVLGLYLVNGLFPDSQGLAQAAEMIQAQHPDVSKPEWGALLSGLSNSPEKYSPELITNLKAVLGAEQWTEKMQLLSFEGTVNPEKILPAVLLMGVAKGMRGIMVIALIAASLSTFGGTVNLATGMIVNDFYKKWLRPKASTRELIYASWASVVLLVGCGFLFSMTLENINDIWSWLLMSLGAALLVPTFLRLYWWRFNGSGYAIGTLVGLAGALIQRALFPDLNELYQFVLAMGIGLIGSVAGTLLTAPTDPEVLENFYMKTRPFGVWGHLKRMLSEEEQHKMTQEHVFDLVS
ncbi:MAG: sodium:solute symporter, partial [Verrucomicrobia bacterium]